LTSEAVPTLRDDEDPLEPGDLDLGSRQGWRGGGVGRRKVPSALDVSFYGLRSFARGVRGLRVRAMTKFLSVSIALIGLTEPVWAVRPVVAPGPEMAGGVLGMIAAVGAIYLINRRRSR